MLERGAGYTIEVVHQRFLYGPMPLKADPLPQCFWLGPTSSLSRDRNSLRTAELFPLL